MTHDRSISEHPESEKDDVLFEGKFGKRTLGSNDCTRAIGDAFYKRPKEDSDRYVTNSLDSSELKLTM
jgi:hypothetical protein